jgi:glycyl-tRNA synthetase
LQLSGIIALCFVFGTEDIEMSVTMEQIVALAKHRGFIFPGSDIYGGLANTWDYGPLGVALKNNIKQAWWKKFIQESPYNVGLDTAILMNREVWVASGHVGNFNDPMIDCKSCKARHRADKLIEEGLAERGEERVLNAAQRSLLLFANST